MSWIRKHIKCADDSYIFIDSFNLLNIMDISVSYSSGNSYYTAILTNIDSIDYYKTALAMF